MGGTARARWADVGLLRVVTDLDASALDGTRPRGAPPRDRSTRSGLAAGQLHRDRILDTALELTGRREHLAMSLEPAGRREPGECSGAHSLNRRPAGI